MTAYPIDAPRGFVPKAERDRLLRRIDDLEAEVVELREALATARLGSPVEQWRAIHAALPDMTPSHAGILSALYSNPGIVSDAALYEAYRACIKRRWKDNECAGVVKVHICRVRQRIVEAGGPKHAIGNAWGVGYQMRPEGRAWLKEVLATGAAPERKSYAGGLLGLKKRQSRGNR